MPKMEIKYKPSKLKTSFRKTLLNVLKTFYSRVCRKDAAEKSMEIFDSFCKSKLKSINVKEMDAEINGSLIFNQNSLEDGGNSFFDFVEIEEQTDLFSKEDFIQETGDTIAHWMGTLSCSLRQFNLHNKCKNIRNSYIDAHKLCSSYLKDSFRNTTDKNYL